MSDTTRLAERARLWLWPGRTLYVGRLTDTAPHAHHAVQVCVALEGTFGLRAGGGAGWRRYVAAVVASDALHQLRGGEASLALLYLDPEESQARLLNALAVDAGIRRLEPRAVAGLVSRLLVLRDGDAGAPRALADGILTLLTAQAAPVCEMDSRVERALAFLQAAPNRRARASEVAGLVGLSPSRLGHLFSAHIGLPLRRYLLWLRLQDAIQAAAGGASLTDAAHAAGFADSAHLSRTFRGMFGIAPSDLVRGSQIVQVDSADG